MRALTSLNNELNSQITSSSQHRVLVVAISRQVFKNIRVPRRTSSLCYKERRDLGGASAIATAAPPLSAGFISITITTCHACHADVCTQHLQLLSIASSSQPSRRGIHHQAALPAPPYGYLQEMDLFIWEHAEEAIGALRPGAFLAEEYQTKLGSCRVKREGQKGL